MGEGTVRGQRGDRRAIEVREVRGARGKGRSRCGKGARREWRVAGGSIEMGEGRRGEGEGRGVRGKGRGASGRLAAVHAAFIWRGKRHAEQVASAEQAACLLYWFLGHAVWL